MELIENYPHFKTGLLYEGGLISPWLQRIVLMAPEGMRDFFPEVIKDNLERTYPQGKVELYPFSVPKFEPWVSLENQSPVWIRRDIDSQEQKC